MIPCYHLGVYQYMPQLLELDRQGEASTAVGGLGGIQSPLVPCLAAWQARLWALPDQQLAHYVLDGLREGFRIGFRRQCTLTAASRNLPLAYQQSQVVGEYLQNAGPVTSLIVGQSACTCD